MALISKSDTRKLIPPHEPKAWFECRPLTAGDLEDVSDVENTAKRSNQLIAACIVAWSYKEPVSLESVRKLDTLTFTWLSGAIGGLSGMRDESEKKGLDSESSPTLALAPDDSPPSSGTS